VPLFVVLTLTALKDAIDDIVRLITICFVTNFIEYIFDVCPQQRHRSDNQVNNRLSKVLRNGKIVEERWFKVQVGDVVLMENDNFVAVSQQKNY
jgi:phospholipid-translocating ATPase